MDKLDKKDKKNKNKKKDKDKKDDKTEDTKDDNIVDNNENGGQEEEINTKKELKPVKNEIKQDEKKEEGDLDDDKHTTKKEIPKGKVVKYCLICTFPEEYCDISHTLDKKIAKKEKEENNEEAGTKTNGAVVEKKDEGEKQAEEGDNEKKDEKEEGKSAKEKKKKEKEKADKQNQIKVTNHKRSKKKVTTTVEHIEKFGLSLKDVSKMFSKKFACSSSITRENNAEFITLTGDFGYDIIEYLIAEFPQLKQSNFKFIENVHKD